MERKGIFRNILGKTTSYVSQFLSKGDNEQNPMNNIMNYNNNYNQRIGLNNQNEYIIKSPNIPQNFISNNTVNYQGVNISLSTIGMKIEKFINENFPLFLNNNFEINNQMKNEFNEILDSAQNNLLEVKSTIDKFIDEKINSNVLNIEYLNKSDNKSEMMILKYLQQRYEIISKFYIFLKKLDYFDKFPDNEIEFYSILEKLIVAMNIRKKEDESNNNNDIIKEFVELFYDKMAKEYHIEKSKKFDLYCKLEFINEKFISNFFETAIELLEQNNDNPYVENLYNYLIRIILDTNYEIQNLIKQFPNNIFFNYRNTFWFLSKNNSNNNRHLYFYLYTIYKKILDTKLNNSNLKIHEDDIFKFAKQLHYLNQLYYNYGNKSSNHNKEFYNTKKKINKNLESFGIEKLFDICKIYKDFSTIAKLSFKNKELLYDPLKEYMKKELKYEKEIMFILKKILQLEIKKCTIGSDDNKTSFDYFEDFDDFISIIEIICKNFPKLYEFFLLYKNKRYLEKNINHN